MGPFAQGARYSGYNYQRTYYQMRLGKQGNLIGIWIVLSGFFAAGGLVPDAEGLPLYSKKYTAPCSLCHSAWPLLNKVGFQFKVNGYQLPDSRDGAEFNKVSPDWNLHLDTGNANPPISLRLNGGIVIRQTAYGPMGKRSTRFGCCSEGNNLGLYSAGTVGKDTGYFISYKAGDLEIDQGYVRFVNIAGQGYFGLDIGAIKTSDFDIVSPNREWFGEKNAAYFGNDSLRGSARGMIPGYSDTGFRFFGNPNSGTFSYDLNYVSGARKVEDKYIGHGEGVSAMGRIDKGNLAASLKFWQAKSGVYTFDRTSEGVMFEQLYDYGNFATNIFAPDITNPDEVTNDFVVNFKYETEKWLAKLVIDQGTFEVEKRTDVSGNEFSQEKLSRDGLSLSWIYRIGGGSTFGARYAKLSSGSYTETYNGTDTIVEAAEVALYEFRLDFTAFQNSKVSVQITLDDSDLNARKGLLDGQLTEYQQQNKLLLLWDWAI